MVIINGFDDNTFRPDKLITYNEAIAMLVRAFGFGSYSGNINYYGYPDGNIKAAIDMGIAPDIEFNGNDMISRQDFDAMLLAASMKGYSKNLMGIFSPPVTADECVQAYAKAAMDRNGAMQFALYDEELKGAARDDFINSNWVTGASSPYISEFEIVKTGGSGTGSFNRTQPHMMPDIFEAGTINSHCVYGLKKGADFVIETGVDAIAAKTAGLTELFLEKACAIDSVTVYGGGSGNRLSVISLNIKGIEAADVAARLWDDFGIAVRAGYHCAPLMHRALGTEGAGTVRFSFSYFNTYDEIGQCIDALREIAGS